MLKIIFTFIFLFNQVSGRNFIDIKFFCFSLQLLTIQTKCLWYEGIRDGFNRVYPDGTPKALSLEDIPLLNEMCPNFATRPGVSPLLCCDRRQLTEMQKFKYIVDNLIGRCPSCYFNFMRLFCEMACNPNHDRFIWPLELINITRPDENEAQIDQTNQSGGIRSEWALEDYVDPDEEKNDGNGFSEAAFKSHEKPKEVVEVITKIRYFISDEQANAFIASCW